jgi:hypothetical protein
MKTKKKSPTLLIADSPNLEPTHHEIALAAYSIWEKEGRVQGREMEQWLQAEVLLRQSPQQGAARA